MNVFSPRYPSSGALLFQSVRGALRRCCRVISLVLALAAGAWVNPLVFAQGPLTNGFLHTGVIGTAGESNLWTFSANAGDGIVVRVGEISETNAFAPRIRLITPAAVQQSVDSGPLAAEVIATATNSGTFTIVIDDAGATATGTYRLTLAKTAAPVSVAEADDGGTLTNGILHGGAISVGDLDVWTFQASAGDAVVLRVGETSDQGSFTPWLRVYAPSGGLVDAGFGGSAGEIALTATQTGSYLVVMADGNATLSGAGNYQLTLAKTGVPVAVSSGDDGGAATNGVTQLGIIGRGDLDVWTVTASAGEAIVARAGEIAETNNFTPQIRIFSPTGVRVGLATGTNAAEATATANSGGEYLIVVGDGTVSLNGTGAYRLTLARSGTAASASAGDEGGRLTGVNVTGTIERGDLDVFSFSTCAPMAVQLQLNETSDSGGFMPAMRLYAADGTLISTNSGSSSAQIQTNAAAAGRYVLVVGDGSPTLGAVGSYQLIVNGLADVVQLCSLTSSAGQLRFSVSGGDASDAFRLLTTTNLATPVAAWQSIATNQFSPSGTFGFTNQIAPSDRQRFFRVVSP